MIEINVAKHRHTVRFARGLCAVLGLARVVRRAAANIILRETLEADQASNSGRILRFEGCCNSVREFDKRWVAFFLRGAFLDQALIGVEKLKGVGATVVDKILPVLADEGARKDGIDKFLEGNYLVFSLQFGLQSRINILMGVREKRFRSGAVNRWGSSRGLVGKGLVRALLGDHRYL